MKWQTETMAATLSQFQVLGTPVHILDDYTDWLTGRLAQGQGTHVVTLNAEMSMQAEVNPGLAKIIQGADLIIPDGAGVVLYLNLHGYRVQRCPGIELAEALLQAAATEEDWGVFFYGGAPRVADLAAQKWQQSLPTLRIAGTEHGYHPSETEAALQRKLQTLAPRLILVGLGVPRQEYWIAQHRHLCPNAIWIGVGGSFDIWTGQKFRAPVWLRENHLEWVYRLYKEPWRWRRMLALPHFALRALITRMTKSKKLA